MELAIIIVVVIAVAMYYGLGQNLEVSSRMLTRELIDAERSQKVRVVKGHTKETAVSDADWKSAVANINKIDTLDI